MEKGSNALQRVKEINDTFNHKHPKSNHLDTLTNKLTYKCQHQAYWKRKWTTSWSRTSNKSKNSKPTASIS